MPGFLNPIICKGKNVRVATFSASAWGKMACEGEDLEVEVVETRSQSQGDKTEV